MFRETSSASAHETRISPICQKVIDKTQEKDAGVCKEKFNGRYYRFGSESSHGLHGVDLRARMHVFPSFKILAVILGRDGLQRYDDIKNLVERV